MIEAKVGEFRNRLSAYLKRVRQGAEIVIKDRHHPIGRLIPYQEGATEEAFELIDPIEGYKGLGKISFSKIPTTPGAGDAVEFLLEDRRRR